MSILRIDNSVRGEASVSKTLTGYLVNELQRRGVVTLLEHDLGAEPLPPISAQELVDVHASGQPRSESGRRQLALSDRLVAELMAVDTLVIGAPMYNFGVPATLKAWIDHVCRARVTFRYTDSGPVGLTNIEHGYIVVATGGTPVGGESDFVSGYLRRILEFIGVSNVHLIHADGSRHESQAIITSGKAQIDRLLAGTAKPASTKPAPAIGEEV